MAAFVRQKVPPITPDEKQVAIDQNHGMTGFALETTEQRLFLKSVFHSDDISTVWLDPALAAELYWSLKRLLNDPQETDGAPLSLATDAEPEFGGWWWPPET